MFEIYNEDCADLLPRLKKKYVAVIFDPPYGIGESNERAASRGKLAAPTDYGHFDWDNEPARAEDIALIRSMSSHQVIWGGNYFDLPPTKCWFLWDKMNGDNDFADAEMAWTNLDMAVRIFKHRWNGFLRQTEQEKRVHPTQKPVALCRWVIQKMKLPPGSTILDPYMGSGPVGIAAIQLGYHYMGIEREPQYFAIAKARLEDAERATRGEFKTAKIGGLGDLDNMPLFAEVA